jgi:hypothetical protein
LDYIRSLIHTHSSLPFNLWTVLFKQSKSNTFLLEAKLDFRLI